MLTIAYSYKCTLKPLNNEKPWGLSKKYFYSEASLVINENQVSVTEPYLEVVCQRFHCDLLSTKWSCIANFLAGGDILVSARVIHTGWCHCHHISQGPTHHSN